MSAVLFLLTGIALAMSFFILACLGALVSRAAAKNR